MFKKKPRRNFRQRKNSSGDDEDEQRNTGEGEEDEKVTPSVVNKPLKAAQSRGISCSSKREATPPRSGSSDEEDGGTFEVTEERKQDKEEVLKKPNAILSFSDEKEVGESTFELKKSSDKAVLFQAKKRKEALAVKTIHSTGLSSRNVPSFDSPKQDGACPASPPSLDEDDDNDSDDDDDRQSGKNEDSDSDEDGSRSSLGSSASSRSTVIPVVVIPNAKQIEAARKQRRAARTQKNYISLSRDGQSSAGSTPDHRNDEDDRIDGDDDDELDDHDKRIEFVPRLTSVRERIAQELGESDEYLSKNDEELELWEETQIEKGVKIRRGEQSPSGSESSSYSSSSHSQRRRKQNKRQKGLKVPKTLPAVSVSMVKKRIAKRLESLKEVHRARQAELRRIESDIESAKTSLESLEESSSERQLKFYRSMTLYIHNLVECLQEKVVEINNLEMELHSLMSDQMEALLAQRRQQVKEQADVLQQLHYNSSEQSESSANGADTKCVINEEEAGVPADIQPSPEEEEQLQNQIAEILTKSQAVFSDVQDNFSSVKKILSHFEEWRGSYSESYHSAYISLCLPKLLNPIIRHQLLAWNPLKSQDAGGDFENLSWYTGVETFCHGHGHVELEHTDRQTLSNVIERVVVPKMTAYAELVWDPLSYQQSVCLSDVCHRLKEDYSIFEGEQSKPVKAFIEAVLRRLRSCVDEDIFIPLYPKKILEDSTSPQRHFRDQQFWTAIKLLGNMGRWDSLLPEVVLKELMLEKLLNRYLITTLCSQTLSSCAVDACKKIAESLPLSWFRGEIICLPQLQGFRNHVVQTVHSICKEQPLNDPNTRCEVVEALKVLSKIRCHDSIMALTEKYRCGDVIYAHQLLNQDIV